MMGMIIITMIIICLAMLIIIMIMIMMGMIIINSAGVLEFNSNSGCVKLMQEMAMAVVIVMIMAMGDEVIVVFSVLPGSILGK